MSETFKPGREPGRPNTRPSNSRYKDKYGSTDLVSILAVVALLGLTYYIFNGKKGEQQHQPVKETKKKTGKSRRLRPKEPFQTIQEVQTAIRKEGLESCNLILAVDFTKSNQWNGSKTFGGKNLHDVSGKLENPYQRVMGAVARTLEPFDEDRMIPAYGFGDVETKAQKCFPFFPDRHCFGLDEMSGPTSFAPAIRKAVEVVKANDHSFHLLVIIADGQAIVEASEYPLAIVCIGVGDGPWEDMIEFDDEIPDRAFDNFQFVDFHAIERESTESGDPVEPQFAMQTLMELPAQFKALKAQQKI